MLNNNSGLSISLPRFLITWETIFASALLLAVINPAFSQNNVTLSQADQEYRRAFDAMLANPKDSELTFQFVKKAANVGDLRGAIAALERILLQKPQLANIKLELGMLYQRVGATELGEAYTELALQSEQVPEEVRARAGKLTANARSAASRHKFTNSIYLAGRYESNANAAPSSVLVNDNGRLLELTDVIGERDDSSIIAALNSGYRYRFPGQAGHLLETDLLLYANRYNESDEIAVNLVDVEFGPRFLLGPARRSSWSLKPFFSAAYLELDGDEYRQTLGGGLKLAKAFSPAFRADLNLSYLDHDYSDSDIRPNASERSGERLQATTTMRYTFTTGTSLSFYLFAADQEAEQKFEAYEETGLGIGLRENYSAPFGWGELPWSSLLAVSYHKLEYSAPEPAIDPNRAREDERKELSFVTTIPFSAAFSLSINLRGTLNESRLPNNEYDNTAATLGFNWQF